MSDPVLISDYGNAFYFYVCDRDPTNSEPLVYSGYSNFLMIWWNTSTQVLFWCLDDTTDAMVWKASILSNNLSFQLSSLGVNVPFSRSRTQRNSPSFNTSYQPSTTNDTEVNLTLNFTALLSLSSTVNIQVSTDNSTWTTIFPISKSISVETNINEAFTFRVPIGCYYQIVQASGTAASIVSIYELSV